MNIYACGNPLLEKDSLPLLMLPELRKLHKTVVFSEFDPTEELPQEKELILIDTVINAKDIMLIQDIDAFAETRPVSLHDFDLGIGLKLARKAGLLEKATIIGVPPEMPKNKAVRKASRLIASLLSGSGLRSSCTGHKP
jgi:hypothetical protein